MLHGMDLNDKRRSTLRFYKSPGCRHSMPEDESNKLEKRQNKISVASVASYDLQDIKSPLPPHSSSRSDTLNQNIQ